MAGAPAPAPGPRQPRRGPAPFASFDHDVSDESSPESKQTFQLPEIVEDPAGASPGGSALAPPEQRARSHSSPAVAGALTTPAAPRIDISRASSSSHHDSRDSSPEMALFAGTAEDADTRGRLELGFREDGALELRSSTEELAFLEGAPGEPKPAPAPAPPPTSVSRRHSRKDSQGSEAALLGVSGRTSRLSSVGSGCSAHSALSGFSHASRVSRLSVVSGASRSPSPHKMLLETSFCGPKPIETDPEICVAAVEERLLELAQRAAEPEPAPGNTRDRREVRTEVTVESTGARPQAARASPAPAPAASATQRPASADPPVVVAITPAEEKRQKESRNQARAARSKERSESEVYRNRNRSKDIIRIKLKPSEEYDDDDDDESDHTLVTGEALRKPATLELGARKEEREPPSPTPSRRRTPSPAGAVSRKSSFCSLFKSRETIASPESPSTAIRRKKSLNEGRSRSKSRDRDRDRSTTPSSAGKIRGSVLSLFKTPRRSGASPSPSSRTGSRAGSPGPPPAPPSDRPRHSVEKLKYYEDTRDGVIHIPLRTPPDERPGSGGARRPGSEPDARVPDAAPELARPASAPHPPRGDRPEPLPSVSSVHVQKPVHRTVLPDGSIIIPLHSPTERTAPSDVPGTPAAEPAPPAPDSATVTPDSRRSVTSPESRRSVLTPESRRSIVTSESRQMDDSRNGDLRTESSSDEGRCAEPQPPETVPTDERGRRKQRLVFTTHVGSREQVFSTQFSITKTPSVTSEISESLPGFSEPSLPEDSRPPLLRDTHITCAEPAPGLVVGLPSPPVVKEAERASSGVRRSPGDARSPADGSRERDSSESEGSSEAAPPTRGGSDVEQRGLVVQESFEDELPYVPTTLPLERSLALPMVPVRERGARVSTAGTRRPRAAGPRTPRAPAPPPTPPAPAPDPPAGEKLRIKLPRRPRTASASTAPPRPERPRTRSGGDGGHESRAKTEWIDFEEVPERRKQPKRIQTLPAAAAAEGRDVVFSYVEPEECRCECHATARRDDELPLLATAAPSTDHDLSSPEGCTGHVELSVQVARPFVADFDLRAHDDLDPPPRESPARGARRH